MVSLRCKTLVEEELKRLGVSSQHIIVDLGMVEILEEITDEQKEILKFSLLRSGLEVLDEKRSELIEKIKDVIIDMIHNTGELPRVNYSDYISEKLGLDYTYLSNIFSEVKGTTIQQFIISHKTERAKEMVLYGDHKSYRNSSQAALQQCFPFIESVQEGYRPFTILL